MLSLQPKHHKDYRHQTCCDVWWRLLKLTNPWINIFCDVHRPLMCWRVCDKVLSGAMPSNVLRCELVLFSNWSECYVHILCILQWANYTLFLLTHLLHFSAMQYKTRLLLLLQKYAAPLYSRRYFFWKALNFTFWINEQLWMLLWNISGEELAL